MRTGSTSTLDDRPRASPAKRSRLTMPAAPVRVRTLLARLAERLHADLARNLMGLYVYGSLTQDAFEPLRSDIDCVAVIRRRLTSAATSRLRTSLRTLGKSEPLMRRLQLTILIRRELLQYDGDGWLFQFGRLTRTGSDGNPIIWRNILKSGRVLHGPPPRTFLPPITPALMHAALEREIGYLRAELITKRASAWRGRSAYRRYATLTACRILYTHRTGLIASKPVAAHWTLRHVPPMHRRLIQRALRTATRRLPLAPIRALLDYVLVRVARAAMPAA